jgi:2-keto-4-pentenoate hydratase
MAVVSRGWQNRLPMPGKHISMKPSEIAAALYEAKTSGADLPLPSQANPTLDLPGAYAVQRAYCDLLQHRDAPVGYKAALTAPGAQQAFGFDQPVLGVLFGQGRCASGAIVHRSSFRTPMLETEVGFVLGEAVLEPVSAQTVRSLVREIRPVVELADIGFGRQRAGGVDLVAANSASHSFVEGKVTKARDPNDIHVTLMRGTEQLHTGTAAEVMGDQWEALAWMINTALELGCPIRAGDLMMTGSIGGLQPADPGEYLADYGSFGQIRFTVV